MDGIAPPIRRAVLPRPEHRGLSRTRSRPTIAQLEAFVRIVDGGTFLRAAEQLNVTQPTISQRIRELETVIGAALFERRGPRTTLTPTGASLIGHARRVLAASTEFQQQMRQTDALDGRIRIGMTDTFARVCLIDLLRELAASYPRLETSVLVGDSSTIEGLLGADALDIAVLVEAAPTPDIRMETVGFNDISWLASPVLALPERVTPRDLVDQHILLPSAVSKVHATVHDWFSAAGLSPGRLSTCNSATVMMDVVAAGLAITVQPLRFAAEAIRLRKLRTLSAWPALPAHRVSLGYQTRTLGPGVADIVARLHVLTRKHRLFRP